MYKLWPGQAQNMTILTFIWPLWQSPSTYLKKMFQTEFLLLKGNNCAELFWNPCINVQVMLRTSSILVYDYFNLYLTPATLTFNLPKNVSNGTSPPQGQHLCQIVLKSMHYCTSYRTNPDRRKDPLTRKCTHTHRTKIVTTISRLHPRGLDNKRSRSYGLYSLQVVWCWFMFEPSLLKMSLTVLKLYSRQDFH